MLIKLYPDQICERWEVIGFAIENALPPDIINDSESMNNILLSLMEEKLLCWVYYDEKKIKAIVTTQIIEDLASRQKRLLLYTAYSFDKLESLDWLNGLEALRKYARDKGCLSIVAYTKLEYMVKLAKDIGGVAEHFFVSFPI